MAAEEKREKSVLPKSDELYLPGFTIGQITHICGNHFDKWLDFCVREANAVEHGRVIHQIRMMQVSRRAQHEENARLIEDGEFTSLLQSSPEARFHVELFRFMVGGIHHLFTEFTFDAGGKVLDVQRSYVGERLKHPSSEKAGLLYRNDPFREAILKESLGDALVPIPAEGLDRAHSELARLAGAMADNPVELPLSHPFNIYGSGKGCHKVVPGPGRA